MSTAVPNHRRTKPGAEQLANAPPPAGIKPSPPANGSVGPTSQIPGLSQTACQAPPERTSGRRVGIFETDSDYVKLAKQGGQKGLLSHDVDEDVKPRKPYNPPNWFNSGSAQSGDAAAPPGGRPALSAPFGTDSGLSWERDGCTQARDQVSPDSSAKPLVSPSASEASKYKRTSYDKKAPPVSMSKLLSFAYVEEEEKKSVDDDTSSVTSEQTSTIATNDVDELE